MCDGEMTPVTGGGVTITSSARCDNHSPANICIIKTFDPFLSFPAQGIQNVARFCRLTTRGGMFPSSRERKLSLDTFSNLTRVSSEICKTKYNSLLVSEFRLCVNHKSEGLGSWLQPSHWFTAPGHNISNFQDLTIYFTLSFTYLVSERI